MHIYLHLQSLRHLRNQVLAYLLEIKWVRQLAMSYDDDDDDDDDDDYATSV